MPYLRHTSLADSPAACSFKTLMICSSVNLLLRICPSPNGNGLYPKAGAFKGSRSDSPPLRMPIANYEHSDIHKSQFGKSNRCSQSRMSSLQCTAQPQLP